MTSKQTKTKCVIVAVVGGANLQQPSAGAVRGVISLPLRPLEAKS